MTFKDILLNTKNCRQYYYIKMIEELGMASDMHLYKKPNEDHEIALA